MATDHRVTRHPLGVTGPQLGARVAPLGRVDREHLAATQVPVELLQHAERPRPRVHAVRLDLRRGRDRPSGRPAPPVRRKEGPAPRPDASGPAGPNQDILARSGLPPSMPIAFLGHEFVTRSGYRRRFLTSQGSTVALSAGFQTRRRRDVVNVKSSPSALA